ncbi:hypothetical protein IFR05_002915 [Cadophora sp. M221]|nr:hypothetical protein IFR05_002915 [Cadophora sp. M221]
MADNSDSDSESAAMAAAMGFSSFGGRPATKKRKFNPTTDAFVEGQALEKLDRGGKKGAGSGGNMIPLGKARVIGGNKEVEVERKVVDNGDEIALDEERDAVMRGGGEESSEDEGPQYIDTSRTPPAAEDDGPQYIDTSAPAPVHQENRGHAYIDVDTSEPAPAVSDAEALEMQRRIDAILQSIGSAPPPPSNDIDIPPPGKTSYTSASMLSPPPLPSKDLPNRAAVSGFARESSDTAFMQSGSRGGFGAGGSSRGARSDAGSEWGGSSWGGSSRGGSSRGGHHGRGERNEKWYVGYYDPGFNVNPWEALEKERGLGAVGSWLEYPKNQGRGGQRA